MAFDWTKVEGYREDMTSEEKLALLDSVEMENTTNPTQENTPSPAANKNVVSKAQFDKVASELAAAKKQLRSKMSEDEQREADRAAADAAKDEELKLLRREKALNSYKASYLAHGYDEKLAEEAAIAMVDGDSDAMFAAMKRHAANVEKDMRAKILKETPVPPNGNGPDPEAEKLRNQMAAMRASFGLPPTNG